METPTITPRDTMECFQQARQEIWSKWKSNEINDDEFHQAVLTIREWYKPFEKSLYYSDYREGTDTLFVNREP